MKVYRFVNVFWMEYYLASRIICGFIHEIISQFSPGERECETRRHPVTKESKKKKDNPSRFIKKWSARNYFQTKPPLRNRTFAHLFFSFLYRFGIFLPPLDTYLLFGIFPTVSSPFFFRRKAFDTKNKLNISNNSNNSNNN